jgi:hypothetical protein
MPYIDPKLRPQFDEILDQLPPMDTAGLLGYVVGVVVDKYLLRRADKDTEGKLRFQYQGEVYGVLMATVLDFFHCVNEPYETDVRARAGEVWKSAHRLPGHNGNPV